MMKKSEKLNIKFVALLSLLILFWFGIGALAECPPATTNPLITDMGRIYCGISYVVNFTANDPNDLGEFILTSDSLPSGVTIVGITVLMRLENVGKFDVPIRVTYTAEVGSYVLAHSLRYKVTGAGGGFKVNFYRE